MRVRHAFRRCAIEIGESGFAYQFDRHFAGFAKRGSTLVVTFDNMKSREAPAPRYPWGWEFIKDLGHSHLGVSMTRRNDWFRHAQLFDFFDDLHEDGFFAQFRDVVFYGSSMGGYGALSFAQAAPGCRVVTFVPQTSLHPALVPFETRYPRAFERGDWTDMRYADGRVGARLASQVVAVYDPYFPIDRMHVDRIRERNLEELRCPFAGHKAPRLLKMMGLISRFAKDALGNSLSVEEYQSGFFQSRDCPGYRRCLFETGLRKNHPRLVLRAIKKAEETGSHKFPRYRRMALQKAA